MKASYLVRLQAVPQRRRAHLYKEGKVQILGGSRRENQEQPEDEAALKNQPVAAAPRLVCRTFDQY